jgi:hypothetical protein
MVKKGDVIVVADTDDDERTSVSQNQVTATLCTEALFLRNRYYSIALSSYQPGKMWRGMKQMVNRTLGAVQLGSHLPANTSCDKTEFKMYTNLT